MTEFVETPAAGSETTYKTRAEARAARQAARRAASERVLRPAFRRWAYGIAAAAVAAAVGFGWLPVESSPLILPLLMAVFYVDKTGEPKKLI